MQEIDLEALDECLMSDTSPGNCMLLSELDGFLTGIVVGPEPIPTSEWMSAIWGGEEPAFETEQQMQTVLSTTLGRYQEIAARIAERWLPGRAILTSGPRRPPHRFMAHRPLFGAEPTPLRRVQRLLVLSEWVVSITSIRST